MLSMLYTKSFHSDFVDDKKELLSSKCGWVIEKLKIFNYNHVIIEWAKWGVYKWIKIVLVDFSAFIIIYYLFFFFLLIYNHHFADNKFF